MTGGQDTVEQVLGGNRRAVARLITGVENELPDAIAAVRELHRHAGRARIIGITGPPGTGKSSLVNVLAREYRSRGLRIAIVAVDPTSPFSGGAILGDRIRMQELMGDDGIFIRSMASRGALGGLAASTGDVVTVFDAFGFDRIVIETVGVGQAEVDIARAADTTIVVGMPGMGDEVQAIKAGVLEIGDVFVINKADLPRADMLQKQLEFALTMPEEGGWLPPILKTVATPPIQGVADVVDALERHGDWLRESDTLLTRRRARFAGQIAELVQRTTIRRLRREQDDRLSALLDQVARYETDPHHAAAVLLGQEAA